MENLNNEIWKDVIGYEGVYMISSFGRLLSVRTNKIRKTYVSKSGYPSVNLCVVGLKNKSNTIHSLVAKAFIDKDYRLQNMVVNHKDGNKLNSCLSNIEVTTYSKNSLHAFDIGFNNNHSENCVTSKLSNEDVINIKSEMLFKTDTELSKMYGVSRNTIAKIRSGDNWKRLKFKTQ